MPRKQPPQLKILETNPYDLITIDGSGSVLRKQGYGLGLKLAVLKNLDRPAPSFLLGGIDLTQIQHVPLDDLACRHALVLNNRKGFMLLAIFLAQDGTQKHGSQLCKDLRGWEGGRSSLQAVWALFQTSLA